MKNLLLLFTALSLTFLASAKSKHTIVEFYGEKNKNSKTYIAKLKKGDPYKLDTYLQAGTAETSPEPDFSPKQFEPSKNRNDTRFLSDIYDIDEKKFNKKKKKYYQKYLQEKKRVLTEHERTKEKKKKERKSLKLKQLFQPLKKETRLSKQIKISTKPLRQGKKLKFPGGKVNILIKYKIRNEFGVKTYITTLNSRVQTGETYYLKYYGSDAKRKYFLEKKSTY